jgi:hypothetical protein
MDEKLGVETWNSSTPGAAEGLFIICATNMAMPNTYIANGH